MPPTEIPMSATIRKAEPADTEQLVRLTGFVHQLHLAACPADFKSLDATELAEWFRTRTANPTVKIWIAECDGRAVGYASTSLAERAATPFGPARRWLELDGLVVDPDFRRRGIGRALIRAAVDHAQAEGIVKLELTTWWFNATARTAFEQLGFTPKLVRLEQMTTR